MKISRRALAKTAAMSAAGLAAQPGAPGVERVGPGVWRFRFGTPEKITPAAARKYQPDAEAMRLLPATSQPPVAPVSGGASARGYQVRLPLAPDELIYGFGLQFQSFMQRGLKRKLRVNADPTTNAGDSHAPVPFYVTTRGYGVLVDTARYAVFYAGNKPRKDSPPPQSQAAGTATAGVLPAAYGRFRTGDPSEVIVEIPVAQGIDVYVFGGPAMRDAVQRYNLFAGGGALPPRWGLGFWYRCHGESDHEQVRALARDMRERRIPCDVLGLEPGWQTHAYSCSFVWSNKFPEPARLLGNLQNSHFRVNLWEHAFTHPTSPIHDPLKPHSGDYLVWDGLVPDFLGRDARAIFGAFHEKEHVAIGADGYKLDECDNSDYTRNWSFPELSSFPSGADGEQMHSLFGLRYQDAIQGVFEARKQPTYGLVRSSGAFAAPYPYVLYSDLYDHREFIRGLVNSGFCGLLWCPEVRDAKDGEDLLRRLETVVFSPLAMVNAWYIRNPPWKQVDRRANNAGEFAPGWEKLEAACRDLIEWRMRLLPYLHSAFARYRRTGLPPFRALVLDWPADAATFTIDDQYMMGDSLLVAPVISGDKDREVYLPAGDWFDLWTGDRIAGGRRFRIAPPPGRIPVYVRGGAVLPLAEPTLHTDDEQSWHIEVRAYGGQASATSLYDGDAELRLHWDGRRGRTEGQTRYRIINWTRVGQV